MNEFDNVKTNQTVVMEGPVMRGLKFRLKKFLAKMNLIEQEEKMLEEEVRDLETDIKQQKIKNIINKF